MSTIFRMLPQLLLLAGFLLAEVDGHRLVRMGVETRSPSFRNLHNRRHVELSPVALHAKPWTLARTDRYLRANFFSVNSLTKATNNTQQAPAAEEVQILSTFRAGLTSDPLGTLKSWSPNDSSVCHWEGVTCEPRSGSSRVVGIHLGSLGLAGTISPSLGGLTFLHRLDLSNNSFRESMPIALVNCSRLSYLALYANELSGEIPSQIGDLLGLRTLNLSSNFLTGSIPVSIVNCSSLSYLDLGYNNLTGEIPLKLGQAIHLQVASLNDNSLSGSIPESLGNCTSLVELHLDSNFDLVGDIPTQLSNLRELQQLTLANNNMGGTFPSWTGNITALAMLDLSSNNFKGEIPEVFGKLQNLKLVTLQGNNFTGNFPVSLTNCSSLVTIQVARNLLSGALPPQIGRLRHLQELFTAINMFSAVLPSSLSNCSSLTTLSFGQAVFSESNPQSVPSWLSTLVNLTRIDLVDMGLEGEIPPELGNLPNLLWLSLWSNRLTGTIPTSLANCTNMQLLQLDDNQLTGNIPSELGSMVNMVIFCLYDNDLTGPLPTFLANFTEMQYLEVHINNLKGRIQTDFGALSNLVRLRLYDNSFTGPIPPSISNCSNLQQLFTNINQFSGPIPPSLGNVTGLGQLWVSDNLLQGSIPAELIGCTTLNQLVLASNLLEGTIPQEIFQLSYLQDFEAANNRLSGVIPSSLGSCESLLNLDLSYNMLNGSLPAEAIGNLSLSPNSLVLSNNLLSGPLPVQLSLLGNIVTMDLSVNNFSGSIPVGLARCTALSQLDLSFNNLTGPISGTLGQLRYLDYFNVSYNHLEGPIPDSGVFKSNISAASFLGNSGLCGSILPRKCLLAAAPDPQAPPLGHKSCHGFGCRRVWIPIASVGAAFMFITAVALVLAFWRLHVHGVKKLQNTKDYQVMKFSNFLKLDEKEILEIIDKEENIIGSGARSVVYKGTLPGGEVFAAKVLHIRPEKIDDREQQAAATELYREVTMLAKLRHRNIVRVSGFFSSLDLKAILLEYVPQGSLDKHLYGREVCKLTLATRMKIALGIAQGLVYLHEYFHEPIIHRDLKPSNVLLDENFEPKLGDFGISKFVNPDRCGEATASTFCGTTGYMPPEYGTSSTVSTKGDVYSFGVILLELLTRKQPTSVDNFEGSENLVSWVQKFQDQPSVLLDPEILAGESRAQSRVELEQINLLVRVGLLCTHEAPQRRPGINDVLNMFNKIKQTGVEPATYQRLDKY